MIMEVRESVREGRKEGYLGRGRDVIDRVTKKKGYENVQEESSCRV